METEKLTNEKAIIDAFMNQAIFYQKVLHEIIEVFREKGLDVSGMSIVHCGTTPGKTRVGRSFLAAPEDILSMLDDIDKAFPEIIERYMLIKKNR